MAVASQPVDIPIRLEPERDRYGRYVIPDPVTGKHRSWTRATTWATSIADTFALTGWKQRMVAVGLARRPDLLAGVASIADIESKDGKKRLDQLCENAKEHAGASTRANLGSALHSFVEHADLDRELIVPQPWDADVRAYQQALEQYGITVSRNYVEKICVLRYFGIAGTMDRLVRLEGRELPMVMDVKTGADLGFSWTEIAIQLAIYARADSIWDVANESHYPMLKVDREQALVMHLPAGKAICTPYIVNIAEGWKAVNLCALVREWRVRKDLAAPLGEQTK